MQSSFVMHGDPASAGVGATIAFANKILPVATPRVSGALSPTLPSSDARNSRILPRRFFFISAFLLSAGASTPARLTSQLRSGTHFQDEFIRYGSEVFPLETLESKYDFGNSNILNTITAKVFSR